MPLTIRTGRPDDATECGRICYEALASIASRHGFASEFPTREAAVSVMGTILADPEIHTVIAEMDGRICGSNSLNERGPIAGVGPITVDPIVQDRGIGRELMRVVMERARVKESLGVRLVQAAYDGRSLSLYAKLGFVVREPLVCLQGIPPRNGVAHRTVREAEEKDQPACDRLCRAVHGHDRGGEVRRAIRRGAARVVEFEGRLTGYAAAIGWFGHTIGEANVDVEALVSTASAFPGSGILVPTRNAELFRWCLEGGLRVEQPMNLMTVGFYQEPAGAYLPSVLY